MRCIEITATDGYVVNTPKTQEEDKRSLKNIKTVSKEFNLNGSVHRKNILKYIQQDATLYSIFYLETALHFSGGTTTHHQERIQLYLQHLVFVTLLLLPAAVAARSSNNAQTTSQYVHF